MKPLARSVLTFITAFAALAAFSTGAFAQYVSKADDEIVVVPYGVQTRTIDRSSSGARIQLHTLSRVVTTAGLDLRYDADVHELQRRVEYTARMACNELDERHMDVALDSDRDCRRAAVRDAMAQVDDAVWRARG